MAPRSVDPPPRSGRDDHSRDFDDAPIDQRKDDRFGRWPFAERIARVLATRPIGASIVIGLYGPWGDGKTSVLNMMAGELNGRADVTCVRFNPWYFHEPQDIVRALFETMAAHVEALGSGPAAGDAVPALLRDYGSMLSLSWAAADEDAAPRGLPHGRPRGRPVSTFTLETAKAALSKALIDAGRRLVVLVDDVDRLELTGIEILLKLVNLSASLSTVSYVLAIDAEVVEAALGQRYGSGDPAAGRQFLEKIIQVPLHLPDAETADLRAACLDGVNLVIRENEIRVAAETMDEFLRHFSRGLVPGLRTPRQVKRYVNAIRFAVPLLSGEVHILDQLLLEGMRVVYPQVYVTVREHPDAFLGAKIQRHESGRPGDGTAGVEVIESSLSGLDADAREGARHLLKTLFPRLHGMLGKTTYGPQWDRTWELERRIASRDYFRRYFQYSVPVRDIGDADVARLVQRCNEKMESSIDEFFSLVRQRDAWTAFFRKIALHLESLTAQGRESLVRGLADASTLVPAGAGSPASPSPARQAAALLATIFAGIAPDKRRSVAVELVERSSNLSFLAALFAEFTDASTRSSLVEKVSFGQTVANRIGKALEAASTIEAYDGDLETLLSIWRDCAGAEPVKRFVSERLKTAPQSAIQLLHAFGRPGGAGERSTLGDIDQDRYQALVLFVDANEIAAVLQREFETIRESVTPENAYEQTGDARLAARFIVLHRALGGTDTVTA